MSDIETTDYLMKLAQRVAHGIAEAEGSHSSGRVDLIAQILQANGVGHPVEREVTRLLTEIRGHGWSVAVHNDYKQHGGNCTFWLFTKGNRCIRGEGPSDIAALSPIEKYVRAHSERPDTIQRSEM